MAKKICLAILLLFCSLLPALRLIPDSAFAPDIQQGLKPSLLSYPQRAKEDSISIYNNGLYLPFVSRSSVGDAVLDICRLGNANYSLLSYQSPDYKLRGELNFIGGLEPVKKDDSYSFLYRGWLLKSQYGKHIEMNTKWWNGIFKGDQKAAKNSWLVDGYSNTTDEKLNIDNPVSYTHLTLPTIYSV